MPESSVAKQALDASAEWSPLIKQQQKIAHF